MGDTGMLHPSLDDFGARLWALRRAAGLNRKAFAEQVGLSDSAVGKWERASRQSPRHLGAVALAISSGLGLDQEWAHWLVFGGDMPAEQGVLATDRYLDMLLVAA